MKKNKKNNKDSLKASGYTLVSIVLFVIMVVYAYSTYLLLNIYVSLTPEKIGNMPQSLIMFPMFIIICGVITYWLLDKFSYYFAELLKIVFGGSHG